LINRVHYTTSPLLPDSVELDINTNAVDNILKICLLSMPSFIFTLDNTFISSLIQIFMPLLTN